MTELLYYLDGYLKEIEATVVEIRGNALVFDRTIFYPECGGQPGDRGVFMKINILDCQKDTDDTPLHIVEDASRFKVGDRGVLSLDWHHRYQYMKEHSAQHLLSALLFHEYGIGTVSVHQGEDVLTIETDVSEIGSSTLLSLEDKANENITKGLKIYQKEMSHVDAENLHMRRSIKVEGRVKVVFIEGLDAVACGGVHVASTSEIGEICFRGIEKIRGHIRTMWSCSESAKRYRRENEKIALGASKLLSSERENILAEIERLQREVYNLQKTLEERDKQQAQIELNGATLASDKNYIIFSTKLSVDAFQDIVSECGKEVFIVQSGEKKGFLYFGTKDRFLILKELGLKGGGRTNLFRGTYLIDGDDLIEKVENILAK